MPKEYSDVMVNHLPVYTMSHGLVRHSGTFRYVSRILPGRSTLINSNMLHSNCQSRIPAGGNPLCLILYADKTKLSSFGTTQGSPFIARCANLPAQIRNGEGYGGGRVVGWLPIVHQPSPFLLSLLTNCLLRSVGMYVKNQGEISSTTNGLSGTMPFVLRSNQLLISQRQDVGFNVVMVSGAGFSLSSLSYLRTTKNSAIPFS